MEAKLIKNIDGYELFTQGFLKGSTNHGLIDSLNIEEGPIRYKLSLKNCQAIELGYNLDELAKIEYPICEVWNDEEALIRELAFKKGFQKALEILGDKKFSYEDMEKVFVLGVNSKTELHARDKAIQSLQQTEWEVGIEMEKVPVKMPGVIVFTKAPKLDADGCLILKLKSE